MKGLLKLLVASLSGPVILSTGLDSSNAGHDFSHWHYLYGTVFQIAINLGLDLKPLFQTELQYVLYFNIDL